MRRAVATLGLPKVEECDRQSITREGISDREMQQLRTDNPVLHTMIVQGLEELAPQNIRHKQLVRNFLGKILGTIQAADTRETLSNEHPELATDTEFELLPAA